MKKSKKATVGERIAFDYLMATAVGKTKGPKAKLARRIDAAIRRAVREASIKAFSLGQALAQSDTVEMKDDLAAFKAKYGVKL